VLLDAGVDVNCRDAMETTPLMIAAAVGHYRILRSLANHPQVDLHAQVSCTTVTTMADMGVLYGVEIYLVLAHKQVLHVTSFLAT